MATSMNATQMPAAIRAANEAILRARNKQEMFQGVCDAAACKRAVHGVDVSLNSWDF